MQSQKWQNDLGCFQGKSFNITVIQVYAPNHRCWRSWSWLVLWRPTRFLELTPKKRCAFHHRGLEWKIRKSRDTWNNRQVWPSKGFPCGSAGKEFACNVGDLGSIPVLGRSPGEGNGYPFQYSSLENSMDSIYSLWSCKELDTIEQLSLALSLLPSNAKWRGAKANRVLSREHTGHSKHPFSTI